MLPALNQNHLKYNPMAGKGLHRYPFVRRHPTPSLAIYLACLPGDTEPARAAYMTVSTCPLTL